MDAKNFCKSCITYMRSMLQCYKPYGSLKQLLISEHLWKSVTSQVHRHCHSSITKYMSIMPMCVGLETAIETAINASL